MADHFKSLVAILVEASRRQPVEAHADILHLVPDLQNEENP